MLRPRLLEPKPGQLSSLLHSLSRSIAVTYSTERCVGAGGLADMPTKEADAHMLSTLMQVQDFLQTHRSATSSSAYCQAPALVLLCHLPFAKACLGLALLTTHSNSLSPALLHLVMPHVYSQVFRALHSFQVAPKNAGSAGWMNA